MEWFDLNIIWLLLTFKYIDDRSKLFLSLNNNSTKSKILLKLQQQHQFQPNEAYFPESIKVAHRINAKIVGPFIHCSFGKEYYNNSDQAKSYLSSLEQSVPGAIVYISVSTFTSIDFESFKNYNLKIYFDRFGELTKEDIKKKYEYSQSVRFYYSSLRFEYYKNFFISHPEYEYAMFSDEDTLILKNPFDLLKSDTEVVHIMYDFVKYSDFTHPNAHWLRAWSNLFHINKKNCGLKRLNETLFSNKVKSLHPLNAGLMIGKVKYLLKICDLISSIYKCAGMFLNNAEQGLLNYLFIAGQLDEIGIKFHTHTVEKGLLISCPNYLNIDDFSNKINSGEVYALHHYHWLLLEYVNRVNKNVKRLILYTKLKNS